MLDTKKLISQGDKLFTQRSTLMLLWQKYVAAHPEGRTWRYTQFCEH